MKLISLKLPISSMFSTCIALLLASCANTAVLNSWADLEFGGKLSNKVLVLTILRSEANSRQL